MITNTKKKSRLANTALVTLIAVLGGTAAYAGDGVAAKGKKTKQAAKAAGLVDKKEVDASLPQRFDDKKINKALARALSKGKGPLLAFAGCTTLDDYDCMTITLGNALAFSVYVVIDKPCEIASRAKGTTISKDGPTCFGGYGLTSRADVTTTGWQKTTYQTRSGMTRTKHTHETTTSLYVAGSGAREIALMKLFTRTEYRVEVFSSGQVNTNLSIYDAEGNVYNDPTVCPPDGNCKDLGSTYIASKSSSIKDCDQQFGDGGTQDKYLDGAGDAIILLAGGLGAAGGALIAVAVTCSGVVTCPAAGFAATLGGGLGGALGGAVGIAIATHLQVSDDIIRDEALDDCRASYTCDDGKATSEGVDGCSCADDDKDATDPNSCASAKTTAGDGGSAGNAKSDDGGDPSGGFLDCKTDTDCFLGWRCDTQTETCIQ